MNAKLGEGYLYYKNDYLERRIKVIPQLPVFENKNSNDSGTLKASLSWTAPEVYWEDVEETVVRLKSYKPVKVNNQGDIPCSINLDIANYGNTKLILTNNNKKIQLSGTGDCEHILIDTYAGEKKVISENEDWIFLF